MPFWGWVKSLFEWIPGFVARLPGWISAGYEIFIGSALRCTLRLALWALTIIVAVAPLMYVADVRASLDIYAMASKINNAGLFRDLIYVVVVVSILGFGEVLTVFVKKLIQLTNSQANKAGREANATPQNNEAQYISPLVLLIYFLSLIGFIVAAGWGVTEFAHLATSHDVTHIASDERFDYDMKILVGVGIVGLFVELVLAFQGE